MQRRDFLALPLCATTPLPAWQSNEWTDPGAPSAAIERWKDLRFGMFIHWGPVSLVGTEIGWSRGGERRGRNDPKTGEIPVEVYDNLYRKFDPVEFHPEEWVRIAKDAGMKYIVFTSKHHDGFCNFDTKLSNYKITSPECPYGKDIVKQLSGACHRGGTPWGVYYSQPDWHHPDYRNGEAHARYIQYLHGQVRELLTGYGDVGMWFFDGLGGKAADWDAARLIRMMRELQPEVVINNRAGLPADYDTPEQRIGFFDNKRPWETCATVGTQWAYKPNDTLRSIEECVRGLVCCAIGDGNLLFNVGPRPDGRIEPSHAARLREMGDFLRKHGESIYSTRGGPFLAPDQDKRPAKGRGFALAEGRWWGGSTHRGTTVYLHILRWPGETVRLPAVGPKLLRHAVLTGGTAKVSQTASGIEVGVPREKRHPIDTIVRLEFSARVNLAA